MKNKKKGNIFIVILVIAVLLFLGLYFIYNYSEPNILNSKDKKWITENGKKVISIDFLNNVPLYSNNEEGILFKFLDYVTEESTIEFNKVSYLYGTNKKLENDYKFEYVDGSTTIDSNQLLIYSDSYILVGTTTMKINSIKDINELKVGVLKDDYENLAYYLSSLDKVDIKTYDAEDLLFKALDNGTVNGIIIPNIIYLDKTLQDEYEVNYFFTEINKNLVLTLSETNTSFNEILTKCYNNWFKNDFIKKYNEVFLNYYIEKMNINDKTKADLLSKTYTYGYVENAPYETKIGSNLQGIAVEYINRIQRLTDIDIEYNKYESKEKLKKAIEDGKVDIYFDYINTEDTKYLRTKSMFIENFVVLGNYDQNYVIGTLEALKGKNVSILDGDYLYKYISSNTKANLKTYSDINKITEKKDNIIILDKEVYTYYRDSLFNDYDILYIDSMTFDYSFMIKNTNETFYKLFNYIINTNSYYNYRNSAYNNLQTSIFDRVSFEELYLIILGIILVPLIIVMATILIIKNKKKLKLVRKEDRKKYTDLLTSLKNRNYLNLNIEDWDNCKIYPQTIIVIDLNNTKYVNDNYGREKGDLLIQKAAGILINTQLENTEIIRSDGNEFLIYMVGYNDSQVETYIDKLSKTFKDLPYGFGAAIGYSMIQDNIKTIDDAMNEATIDMQSDKERYH